MSATEESNEVDSFNFDKFILNVPPLPQDTEEKLLESLLTKLKLTLPALKESSKSLTTIDIIEHAILYIRQLWSMLEDNGYPNDSNLENKFSPSNKLGISFLTV